MTPELAIAIDALTEIADTLSEDDMFASIRAQRALREINRELAIKPMEKRA